jgi:hypothetical protein
MIIGSRADEFGRAGAGRPSRDMRPIDEVSERSIGMRKIPKLLWILLGSLALLVAAIPAFSAPAAGLQSGTQTPVATPTRVVMPNTTPAPGVLAVQPASGTTYVTIRVGDDGKAQVYSLRLGTDGAAEFAVSSVGEAAAVLAKGTWTDNADGTLTVTMPERQGQKLEKPIVIKFKKEGTDLTAVEYDQAMFGATGFKLAQAAEVARKVKAALFTIDLQAGFPLDPTFMSVQGGGEVDASMLGGGCTGFINENPVVTVNWTGKADFAQIFFYSNDDPTLVVLAPDGKVLCNDDAGDQLLDPSIRIENPPEGVYRIWVGSYARRQLIPGVLVLTTKAGVNVGEFSLANLIKRPALLAALAQPTPQVPLTALQQELSAAAAKANALQAGAKPVTVEVTSEGTVPAFSLSTKAGSCAGLVSQQPDYTFNWTGQSKDLRIFFEGELDASLLVLGPDGLVRCNDDAQAGANVNPVIDLPNPAEGTYLVFVGRLNPTQPVKGKLTITEAADARPTNLAPSKQ